jgi:hypothetical protein
MSPRYTVADSDSESEPDQSAAPPHPSDEQLEKALRETVAKIFKTGKMEELTVKRVRLAAEKTLQIQEGFFKSNGDWKARSDTIIKDEVVGDRSKTYMGLVLIFSASVGSTRCRSAKFKCRRMGKREKKTVPLKAYQTSRTNGLLDVP